MLVVTVFSHGVGKANGVACFSSVKVSKKFKTVGLGFRISVGVELIERLAHLKSIDELVR